MSDSDNENEIKALQDKVAERYEFKVANDLVEQVYDELQLMIRAGEAHTRQDKTEKRKQLETVQEELETFGRVLSRARDAVAMKHVCASPAIHRVGGYK